MMTIDDALAEIEAFAEGFSDIARLRVREVLEQLSEDSWQRGVNQAQEC